METMSEVQEGHAIGVELEPITGAACEASRELEVVGTPAKPHAPHAASPSSPSTRDTQLCYETQLFGFTPMSFSDEIHNALLQYSWDALEQAQLIIKKEFPTRVTGEDVDAATQDITAKMVKVFQDAFDKLEMYLIAQIFHIEKHVVLPEDAIQEQFPDAPDSLQTVDAEINELKSKIREAKVTNACLRRELGDISVVQVQLDKTLAYVNDVTKIMSPEQCELLGYVCSKALQLKRLMERIDAKPPPAKKLHIEIPLGTSGEVDVAMLTT